MASLFHTVQIQDVIWVDYPYEDDPTKSKVRPGIILDKDNDSLEVVVVKVTSQFPKDEYDYEIIDWIKASLRKKSFARASKIEVIEESGIKGKIGKLSDDDFNEIVTLVSEYIASIQGVV